MTDRLMTLLHGEAYTLDVPPAPAAEILGSGRRLRRRRTWVQRGVALALVATVGGVGVAALQGRHASGPGPATDPTTTLPNLSGPFAWGIDDTVYLGAGAQAVQMPEVAQTLYYTSAGILVRTNKDGSSDGGAPFHFQLVARDGTASPVHVTLGEVVPSTDPTQPYLAWATMHGTQIQVVVHDVATDQDVATVDVPGTFSWGGWAAPPVSLSGDDVYVGNDDSVAVVNWRTGAATTTSVLPGSVLPDVEAGRSVVSGQGHARVVDVGTGRTLVDIPIARDAFVTLSPDGRFATTPNGSTGTYDVYDVDAGTHVSVDGAAYDVGWTPHDDLFSVRGGTLEICDPTTGDCRQSSVPPGGNGLVRYTGRVYES